MATFQPYASNAQRTGYDLAVLHKAMRADTAKLRAKIGQKGPTGDWDYRPSVLNCAACNAPLEQGQWISHGHTRNRNGSASFPGWQHWHITCPKNGDAYRLPGQSNVTDAAENITQPASVTQPAVTEPTYTNPTSQTLADALNNAGASDPTEISDDMLAGIIKAVVDAINPILANASSQTQQAVKILTDALAASQTNIATLRTELEKLRESVVNAVPVQIAVNASDPDASYVSALPTLRHKNFALLVRAAAKLHARLPKQANIWLVGPAGTGKSTAGEQLAASLRYTTGPRKGEPLDFHYQGAIDQPYLLLGYADAHGNVVRTPMREAWEHGGVLMLDELDASSESATLAANGPLANGYCYFPVEPGKPAVKIMRHPDCIVLGTANTNGMGADATYVGRNRLDGAFLSRFPTKIDWSPDPILERTLTNHDAWYAVVSDVRSRCAKKGVDFLVTSRDMMTGAAYLADGDFTNAEVVELIFGSMQRQDPDAWADVGQAARAFAAITQPTAA